MKQLTLALLAALASRLETTSALIQGPWPPSAPTQPLFSSQCAGWDITVLGDDCYHLALQHNLTLDAFIARNPQLQAACNPNLWAGYAFCVLTETRGAASAPPTTALPPTSILPSPSPTFPQPSQSSGPPLPSSNPSPPSSSSPCLSSGLPLSPSIITIKTTYTLLSKEIYISRVPGPTVTCTVQGPTVVSIIKTGSGTLYISEVYAATTTVPVPFSTSIAPTVTVDVTVSNPANVGPDWRVTLRGVEGEVDKKSRETQVSTWPSSAPPGLTPTAEATVMQHESTMTVAATNATSLHLP